MKKSTRTHSLNHKLAKHSFVPFLLSACFLTAALLASAGFVAVGDGPVHPATQSVAFN